MSQCDKCKDGERCSLKPSAMRPCLLFRQVRTREQRHEVELLKYKRRMKGDWS